MYAPHTRDAAAGSVDKDYVAGTYELVAINFCRRGLGKFFVRAAREYVGVREIDVAIQVITEKGDRDRNYGM